MNQGVFVRIAAAGFVVAGIVLYALLLVQPAHADPHAMFYTAVGQQQLFFNMLAALDQADYVEPAVQTNATPPGNSRAELLQQREQAGFGPEQDPRVNATQTDLASILTRNITLEGNDLWSSYLAHQFALETARRRNTEETIRIFCQRGLGSEDCGKEGQDAAEMEEEQKKAFHVDPVELAKNIFRFGPLALLTSNSDPSSLYQQNVQDARKNEEQLPVTYEDSIAQTRTNLQNDPAIGQEFERTIAQVQSSYLHQGIDTGVLNNVSKDSETGEIKIKSIEAIREQYASNPEQRDALIGQETIEMLYRLIALPYQIRTAASRAQSEVTTYLAASTSDGHVADTELIPVPGEVYQPGGPVPVTRGLEGRIRVPASAKTAVVQEAISAVSNTEQNLAYAPPLAEHQPGSQETIDRSTIVAGAQTVANQLPGSVQGLNTTNASPQGNGSVAAARVAAATDPSTGATHQQPVTPLDPGSNVTAFHHEVGATKLLKLIGFEADRGGCGCSTQQVTNAYGQAIINSINQR